MINGTLHYFFKVKTLDELIEKSNLKEYIKLTLLLLIGQHSFDLLKIYGLFVYLSFTFSLATLAVVTLYYDLKNNGINGETLISHLFLLLFMFLLSKGTYTRINGDEVIDSFFEKPEYRTKYYVNLFPEINSERNYRLIADIHVYEEEVEDYVEDKTRIYKFISIERVYFKNGGCLYFDDCQVEVNKKTYCIDQNSRGWYIELTDTKAPNENFC